MDEAAIERAARALYDRSGGICRACGGTELMEDGPPGATYSAPCTYCERGIPNRYREEARTALLAASEDRPGP